jgi:GNAT superfamily N-acetyltransferase
MNVRPATRDDYAAIADLFGSVEEKVWQRPPRLSAATIDGWLQTIAFDTNTWLFEDEGTLVAGAFVQNFGGRANSAGAVRPSHWGRGLGAQVLETIEARAREEGAERIHNWTVAGDAGAERLLPARGFEEARRFWEMAIELGDDLPEPAIAIETFCDGDEAAYHDALEESFADHWEHRPESLEEWWTRQRRRANFDTSLWFLIRDGGEIVAVCRNEERPGGGYVGAVGVRPAWRGKGYARALLQHSFREFRRRGHDRASLGVDAANATGATQLYESVGMHVDEETVVWRKILT